MKSEQTVPAVQRPFPFHYDSRAPSHTHDYLVGAVLEEIRRLRPASIFEAGCGNGIMANAMSAHAPVTAIDLSETGVSLARSLYPHVRTESCSVYEDLQRRYGSFPVVVSLEVVEHLYDPRCFAARIFHLLDPGGTAIISTPYHGYLKNLSLALAGRLDGHFTALWDGGHIKFWSPRTLRILLQEAGFRELHFRRVGRIPPVAKSMIATARRPG